MKKKVAYLIGTGAIQASLDYEKYTEKILMKNIKDMMFREIYKQNIKELKPVINQLGGKGADVEHLISLYSQAGYDKIAKSLKQLFFEVLTKVISNVDSKSENGVFVPKLLLTLFDMYNIKEFNEKLVGILTINYEDLIERALAETFGAINYGFKIKQNKTKFKYQQKLPPIIKIHGSFNWENSYPINVSDELVKNNDSEQILWLPPSITKDRSRYPFNKAWGISHEILECDILRVIGCSLNRNDWHLISLLYITQQISQNKRYIIELINFDIECKKIIKDYDYLSFESIFNSAEFKKYFKNKYDQVNEKNIMIYLDDEGGNVFEIWLKSTIGTILPKDIHTDKNYVYKFYNDLWE